MKLEIFFFKIPLEIYSEECAQVLSVALNEKLERFKIDHFAVTKSFSCNKFAIVTPDF